MTKVFSQQVMTMLGIAGIAGISLMTILGAYISKLKGSFAPYRKATIVYLLVAMLIFALVGFIGYKTREHAKGMQLILNNNIFFEFVPFDD